MDKKKIIKIINILHKYINADELIFMLDGLITFNNYKNFFIEYSIKHIFENDEVNIEKRILFGLNYIDTDHDKYFNFMNIEPFDIKDYKNAVYFGYDKTNNIKKIYFEKINVGLICNEYVNDKLNNVKIYHTKKNISDNILNCVPESLRNILKDNYDKIFYFINKNLHIYQFKLKNILNYNDDFYCSVISLAFDNDYNIKYHTFYLRLKDEDLYIS
jgi:hypothetical protein